MRKRKNRNIIICTLCGVLLLMVVGYSVFSTQLNINGTTSITSNWNVLITNVEEDYVFGEATTVPGYPIWNELSASFKVNLVSPGTNNYDEDGIQYAVTIENRGSIDAKLEKIQFSGSENDAIMFDIYGYIGNNGYNELTEGSILRAGQRATLGVYIGYNPDVTSQPDNLEASFEMTLDFVQSNLDENGIAIPPVYIDMNGVKVELKEEGAVRDGLYNDPVEAGRYVYRGANPNNYITFNGETAGWRILAIETDGIIKIMRNSSVTRMAFDSEGLRDSTSNGAGGTYCSKASDGCNAWAKTTGEYVSGNGKYKGTVLLDSEMKTYLNGTYYDSITKNKTAIANHAWYYGSPEYESSLSEMVEKEKAYSAASNVGLIQASDYIKSNTNTSLCGTYDLVNSNYSICKSTTYMVHSDDAYFLLTPMPSNTSSMLRVSPVGQIGFSDYTVLQNGVTPSVYLKSDVELEGKGTQDEPYKIINYVE